MPTEVHATSGATAKSLILLVLFATATVGVGFASVRDLIGGWGFGLTLVLGGVVVLAGHGLVTGGSAGRVSCPECGKTRKIKGVRMERYHRCAGCGTWSMGKRSMARVPDDHVAKKPLFAARVSSNTLAWPKECPVCGEDASRDVPVKGTSALGSAVAAVAPVSVQSVARVDVPHCAQHRDGVEIEVIGSGLELRFRSMPYWRRFVEANDATVPSRGEIWPPECDAA